MCERDVRKPWVSRLARGVHIINKRVLKVTHVKHILLHELILQPSAKFECRMLYLHVHVVR